MSKHKKRTHGNPALQSMSFIDRTVVRDFEQWMHQAPHTFTDPLTARAEFGRLLALVTREGLNALDPNDADDIIEAVIEPGDLLGVLHDYVHFRMETTDGAWDDAHEALEEVLHDGS